MNENKKVKLCFILNLILLIIVIVLNIIFASDTNKYLRFGPNNDLIVISVKIDTFEKYIGLLITISIIKITKALIDEYGGPVLDFTIYNPDKKIITEFYKNELYLLANFMYLISDLRYIFQLMATISQIDIALYGTLMSFIGSLITSRLLLNEKVFIKNNEEKNEIEEINNTIEI
jgi:hypothetical protein